MTSTEFRHNHYVPRWYQERFLPGAQKQRELYYLHKEPRAARDSRGRRITLPEIEPRALKNCFAKRDLYTLTFRDISSTELERRFFGQIDRQGREAVNFWTSYDRAAYAGEALQPLLIYLSTQKLRTPKGLDWLARQTGSRNPLTPAPRRPSSSSPTTQSPSTTATARRCTRSAAALVIPTSASTGRTQSSRSRWRRS